MNRETATPATPQESFLATLDHFEALLISMREEGIKKIHLHHAPSLNAAKTTEPLSLQPGPICQPAQKHASDILAQLADEISTCTLCQLHNLRCYAVPGQGCLAPELVFLGEAPGAEEDSSGQAFVGPAGEMLTRIIQAMGLERSDVFITNALKCRPPKDRLPLPGELQACLPYLKNQLAVLAPRIVVALGPVAAAALADPNTTFTFVPGAWWRFAGADVVATYHPAYLLRHPAAKKQVWADMQAVLAKLGRPVPKRKQATRRR